jgi:flagellar biosynthesis chaperone FliJ
MLSDAEKRHKVNLEHARWRVSFLIALLQSHRRLPRKWGIEWQNKENDCIQRLAAAQVELERLERLVERERREVRSVPGEMLTQT